MPNRPRRALLASLLPIALLGASDAAEAQLPLWLSEIQPAVEDEDALARSVSVDGSNDILVGLDGPGIAGMGAAKLFGADGQLAWGPVVAMGNAWEPDGEVRDSLVDGAGDFYVAGAIANRSYWGPGEMDMAILKLDGDTGAVAWGGPFVLRGSTAVSGDGVYEIRLAGAGGLLAVGTFRDGDPMDPFADTHSEFVVFKLDPATGTLLWGPVAFAGDEPSCPCGGGRALAVDGDGDAIATGGVKNAAGGNDLVVVKLDGANGAVQWGPIVLDGPPAPDPSSDWGLDVETDAAGDVFVLGRLGGDDVVMKLSGADGSTVWGPFPVDGRFVLALDASGDVLLSGINVLEKREGDTGALLWGPLTAVPDAVSNQPPYLDLLEVAADGDVIVAAGLPPADGALRDWMVARFDGATGTASWGPVLLDRGADGRDDVSALALTPAGDVVVGGNVTTAINGPEIAAVSRYPGLGPQCQNGLDDDGDGDVDHPDDADCSGPDDPTEGTPAPDCRNGDDDDGDGLVDFGEDAGCDLPQDDSEQPGLACDDGVDNDGDGLVDLDDPGCGDDPLGIEDPVCHDTLDNDGDGLTDLDDPGCNGNPLVGDENPHCNDGLDNDGDGFVDFDGGLLALGYVIAPPDPQCDKARDQETDPPECAAGLGAILVTLAALLRRRRR
jgi:MYXO-CTERM domain-containing protein